MGVLFALPDYKTWAENHDDVEAKAKAYVEILALLEPYVASCRQRRDELLRQLGGTTRVTGKAVGVSHETVSKARRSS